MSTALDISDTLGTKATSPLRHKATLVTGGGSGLGAALCTALAAAGAWVAIGDRRGQAAQQVAERMQAGNHGARVRVIELDVADPAQTERAMQETLADFGRLDVLINNAGIDKTCPLEQLDYQDWDRVLRTNLYGPFLLSKLAAQAMRRQGSGHIVNITSTAAKRNWPNAAAYHASKWGLLGLSHALHAELRASNIKVTAVVCGGMRTPFLLERFPDIDPAVLQDPADVARAILSVLTLPPETVVPEISVLPMRETSWP